MSDQMQNLRVQLRRVTPLEAEVWVVVEAVGELRGRVTGPKCPGIETVQVAYPIRPIARPAGLAENTVVGRVLIPEPNLWMPATPFAYEGTVELWRDEKRCESTAVRIELKTR